MRRIVDLQIARVAQRLGMQQLALDVTDRAKDHIADVGYDPQFGARPLKRVIQDQILNPLSMMIINQEIEEEQTVRIDVKDGELAFKVAKNNKKKA